MSPACIRFGSPLGAGAGVPSGRVGPAGAENAPLAGGSSARSPPVGIPGGFSSKPPIPSINSPTQLRPQLRQIDRKGVVIRQTAPAAPRQPVPTRRLERAMVSEGGEISPCIRTPFHETRDFQLCPHWLDRASRAQSPPTWAQSAILAAHSATGESSFAKWVKLNDSAYRSNR